MSSSVDRSAYAAPVANFGTEPAGWGQGPLHPQTVFYMCSENSGIKAGKANATK